MSIVIGLDIGGSTTKIIGIDDGRLLGTALVRASDPVASAFGAFGKFTNENGIALSDIERVMVTGVGSSYLAGNLLNIDTIRTPEFQAIGLGGLYISGLDKAIVVSLGTGTAFISADETGVEHIIGSGVGGGTMLGLSNRMTNVRDFKMFTELAENGDLGHIDLTIGDISHNGIAGLSSDTTASNFGKVTDTATSSDIALGIVNLVFQSVGTAAVLSARLKNINQIVFTGNLTLVSQGKKVLGAFSSLYGVDIIVPDHAEFATAIGAALCDPDDPTRELQT